jgi:hypothetical protein
MRRVFFIATAMLATVLCISCQIRASVEERSAANAVANEIVYGTENDELTASTGVMNRSVISPNPATVSGTAVFNGLVSGTATVTHNVTWTETDTAGIPFNRTFTFSGTRTVEFSDYSNMAGRTMDSGTVTVNISSGSFSGSTPNANPTPAVGSTVTHAVTNVNKAITGTVTVEKGGNTYTCDIDLAVVVLSRVTEWTLGLTYDLIHPAVQSRSVSVTGTVEVNGKPVEIDKTITASDPEE